MAGAGTLGRQTITAWQASGSELGSKAADVTLPAKPVLIVEIASIMTIHSG
jgi:hypothetical protein